MGNLSRLVKEPFNNQRMMKLNGHPIYCLPTLKILPVWSSDRPFSLLHCMPASILGSISSMADMASKRPNMSSWRSSPRDNSVKRKLLRLKSAFFTESYNHCNTYGARTMDLHDKGWSMQNALMTRTSEYGNRRSTGPGTNPMNYLRACIHLYPLVYSNSFCPWLSIKVLGSKKEGNY